MHNAKPKPVQEMRIYYGAIKIFVIINWEIRKSSIFII